MQLHSNILRGSNKGPVHVLLDLPPPLLEAYENGSLVLRSDESHHRVVACSKTQTFALSLAPQNPTVMLARATDIPDGATTFGVVEKRLEPLLTEGQIDWSSAAVYHKDSFTGPQETMIDLRARSLCSDAEFDELWRLQPGVEVDGKAGALHHSIVYSVLGELVSTIVAEDLGFTAELDAIYDKLDVKRSKSIVSAVFEKFRKSGELDTENIVVWMGLYRLKNLGKDEYTHVFIREWSTELPIKGVDYNLDKLRGHYCTVSNKIRYLDPQSLPEDPRVRFSALFDIKDAWDLDDLRPYIEDVAHKRMKLDSWIKKYARIQSVDAKKVIRPRRA